MNEIKEELKEYRLKERVKKDIVLALDDFYRNKQLSTKSIIEMLEELINLYKN
jgi:hypothetical protein